MAPSREEVVTGYLDRLTTWAVIQGRKLWAQVAEDDIAASWAKVMPAALAVHRVLVMAALDATDDYMILKAGDAGFRYDVDWRLDRPRRPSQIHNGTPATDWFASTVPLVLWRIKRGDPVADAMTVGLNRVLRPLGTEAHEVFRTVTWQRVM